MQNYQNITIYVIKTKSFEIIHLYTAAQKVRKETINKFGNKRAQEKGPGIMWKL